MSAIVPVSSLPQSNAEADKLLTRLLECVQQCQKRYGGKKELATEFDSCVAGLCVTLETAFLHGLRNKTQEAVAQQSTLQQVSDIISNSLHLSNDNPCKLVSIVVYVWVCKYYCVKLMNLSIFV